MNPNVKNILKSAVNKMRGNPSAAHEAAQRAWLRDAGITTVLDIGAHVGTFAAEMREVLPTAMIYAFEPQGDSYEELQRRFASDNKFLASRLALSDENGEADFFRNDVGMASSLNEVGDALKEAYPAATHVRKETVKVERLDDFFTSRKIVLQPKVLLKADVQGAEHRVLNGAVETLKSVSIILLEASFVELYKGQLLFDGLYDILRAHGFRFGGSQKTEVSPKTGMPIWADCIFTR